MKTKFALTLLSALAASAAHGKGLYYVPNDTETTMPIKWTVGLNVTYDDNTSPTVAAGPGFEDETFSLNPYVGMSFVSVTPQTTWDVYARLGVIYYLDSPAAAGSDDTYGQARAGVNMTHRFNERLRLVSNNFISYELEPDYSYGFASSRQVGEYLYWQTDNALGYRWTDRFATYTGFQLTGLNYDDVSNADYFTWTLYNQFRYQITPQSVLTASYRYSEANGSDRAADSTNQYLLAGIEHRFSPNTILIANIGAQLRDVNGAGGSNSTNPYAELTLQTQVNQQFTIRGFLRYGVEDYDSLIGVTQYDEKQTLRIGVSGEYQVSQALSIFGGVDYIDSSYDSGRRAPGTVGGIVTGSGDESLVNAYIGASLKLTEYLTGTLTYNHTTSSGSNAIFGKSRDYDRNRINLGLSADF